MSMKPEEIHLSAASSQRERLRNELLNDHQFLNLLQKRDTVVPDYATKYPNIAANVLNDSLQFATTSNSELFNAATCMEYHLLFKHLMTQYQNAVNKIDSLAKGGAPFESELDFAVITGHMLLTMVKGRAFHLYLSTVAPILSRHLSEVRQIASDERDAEEREADERDAEKHDADERDADERDADERDAEEGDAEPGTTLWDPVKADAATVALWKPFKSWIMLMLVHLDAADALCSFVQQVELSRAEIDVKLVYSPLVSYNTIPLEELLQAGHIREPDGDEKTNAELLDFVKTANVRKKQLKVLGSLQKKWDSRRVSEAKKFIKQVLDQTAKEDAEDSDQRDGGVGPNKTISALSEQLIELLSQQPVDSESICAKFTDLAEELKEGQGLPFTENPTFRGALHCEASLASILDKSTRGAIRARIDQLKMADPMTPKDEVLSNSLSELLEETKVGFFSVQLVPTINPCSIHNGRNSSESSGYQNAAAQCAVVFLLIYHWMETPSPALSRQVSTTPSRAAPYRNGPRNSSWIA
jgi:hypothetical protein